MKEDPACITLDVFLDLLGFLLEYVTRTMFLPGQIDKWNTIVNMGNLGATALPREVGLGFGKFCQNHLLYPLHKSYCTRISWGQNLIYNAVKWMINEDTIQLLLITKVADPPELAAAYHPSQLEKRFGGEAETPTQFWPPYIGPEFFPNDDTSHLDLIKQEDYEKVLDENPNFHRHPFFLKEGQ